MSTSQEAVDPDGRSAPDHGPEDDTPVVVPGDPFDAVVRVHGPSVLRFCLALHTVWADAEDSYSETMLRALRAYSSLDPDTNIEAWLITIARNTCTDAMRRRGRLPVPTEDATLADLVENEWGSVGGPSDEPLVRVVELLRDLTERQRSVIAHRYVWALSFKEIAAELGGTEAAARRAAADGIARLRARWSEYEDEPALSAESWGKAPF
ncbi:RNA polymerase sigma factor [Brevibacterium litoralis]|uniref:RNA polymerase sigma factor n=1 Tax=Brevibacterium litoralis TaxID=3138935 RepID=UPI0032EDA772